MMCKQTLNMFIISEIMQQSNLYRTLVNESAKEYAYFKYGLSYLQLIGADLDNGAVCPACSTVSVEL